jgi:hypothetical protein
VEHDFLNVAAATRKYVPGIPMLSSESGRLLQWCRRLDWRFLLPEPTLGRVAYAGQQGELLDALRAFSESVTVLSENEFVNECLDLVVLRFPSLQTLQTSSRLVKPGRYIYIELLGGFGGIGVGAGLLPKIMAGARAHVRALREEGFDEIEAYWHRPSFENCHEIVPLFDQTALKYVLGREKRLPLSRELKLLAANCLVRSGLLRHFVSCYSIIAHRGVLQE